MDASESDDDSLNAVRNATIVGLFDEPLEPAGPKIGTDGYFETMPTPEEIRHADLYIMCEKERRGRQDAEAMIALRAEPGVRRNTNETVTAEYGTINGYKLCLEYDCLSCFVCNRLKVCCGYCLACDANIHNKNSASNRKKFACVHHMCRRLEQPFPTKQGTKRQWSQYYTFRLRPCHERKCDDPGCIACPSFEFAGVTIDIKYKQGRHLEVFHCLSKAVDHINKQGVKSDVDDSLRAFFTLLGSRKEHPSGTETIQISRWTTTPDDVGKTYRRIIGKTFRYTDWFPTGPQTFAGEIVEAAETQYFDATNPSKLLLVEHPYVLVKPTNHSSIEWCEKIRPSRKDHRGYLKIRDKDLVQCLEGRVQFGENEPKLKRVLPGALEIVDRPNSPYGPELVYTFGKAKFAVGVEKCELGRGVQVRYIEGKDNCIRIPDDEVWSLGCAFAPPSCIADGIEYNIKNVLNDNASAKYGIGLPDGEVVDMTDPSGELLTNLVQEGYIFSFMNESYGDKAGDEAKNNVMSCDSAIEGISEAFLKPGFTLSRKEKCAYLLWGYGNPYNALRLIAGYFQGSNNEKQELQDAIENNKQRIIDSIHQQDEEHLDKTIDQILKKLSLSTLKLDAISQCLRLLDAIETRLATNDSGRCRSQSKLVQVSKSVCQLSKSQCQDMQAINAQKRKREKGADEVQASEESMGDSGDEVFYFLPSIAKTGHREQFNCYFTLETDPDKMRVPMPTLVGEIGWRKSKRFIRGVSNKRHDVTSEPVTFDYGVYRLSAGMLKGHSVAAYFGAYDGELQVGMVVLGNWQNGDDMYYGRIVGTGNGQVSILYVFEDLETGVPMNSNRDIVLIPRNNVNRPKLCNKDKKSIDGLVLAAFEGNKVCSRLKPPESHDN